MKGENNDEESEIRIHGLCNPELTSETRSRLDWLYVLCIYHVSLSSLHVLYSYLLLMYHNNIASNRIKPHHQFPNRQHTRTIQPPAHIISTYQHINKRPRHLIASKSIATRRFVYEPPDPVR